VVVHGGAEVVAAKTRWRERERRERIVGWKKTTGEAGYFFWLTLHPIFFILWSWNPPLFIRGGRGTFCI
jgi:hypothetical protein